MFANDLYGNYNEFDTFERFTENVVQFGIRDRIEVTAVCRVQ